MWIALGTRGLKGGSSRPSLECDIGDSENGHLYRHRIGLNSVEQGLQMIRDSEGFPLPGQEWSMVKRVQSCTTAAGRNVPAYQLASANEASGTLVPFTENDQEYIDLTNFLVRVKLRQPYAMVGFKLLGSCHDEWLKTNFPRLVA